MKKILDKWRPKNHTVFLVFFNNSHLCEWFNTEEEAEKFIKSQVNVDYIDGPIKYTRDY